MATFTDVESQRIRQTETAISQNLAAIGNLQRSLGSNVTSRLTPWWQGEARDLFFRQFNAFSASFAQLVQECETLNSTLGASGRTYEQANDLVRGQLNRL